MVGRSDDNSRRNVQNVRGDSSAAYTEKVCLDIADVVRETPTILRKKIEDCRDLRLFVQPNETEHHHE